MGKIFKLKRNKKQPNKEKIIFKKRKKGNKTQILMQIVDRNGNLVCSKPLKKGSLGFLYDTVYGRTILKLLVRPTVSKVAGRVMDSSVSRVAIKSFVKKNNISLDEYVSDTFKSYNDFFTREIKPEMRRIDKTPSNLISPCDSKLSAYTIEKDSVISIKDSYYSIGALINNEELAAEYVGGLCLIFRLTVDDYHRYCYFDNGTKGKNVFIKGILHTVNPIALGRYNIYKRNSREYTVLETENFGKAVQVEVGALLVGRIKNLHEVHSFKRGEEKGMFEFGGSTVVLLLKKDIAVIDEDILNNTKANIETVVRMGEVIGHKI